MKNLVTKGVIALALGATALATAAPAEAQRYRGGYRHHDGAGTALVAGVAGLAIGAALASGDRGYYYDDYPAYPYPYYREAYPAPYYYAEPYPYPYPYVYRSYGPRYYHGYRGGYGGYHGGGYHGGGGYRGGGHHR